MKSAKNIEPYKLQLLDEAKQVKEEYPLEDGKSLGREACDIIIKDTTVSRKHCSITVDGGLIRIEDLNSKNGVFVRIRESYELKHGDEIQIGHKLFRVEKS